VIEELTAEQAAQLEEGQFRWKISYDNYFQILQLDLQRKGWFFWNAIDSAYPEFTDERQYLSADEYRSRIEAYKAMLIRKCIEHRMAEEAEREFFSEKS